MTPRRSRRSRSRSRRSRSKRQLLFGKIILDGNTESCPLLSKDMLTISKNIKQNPLYAPTWKGIKKNYMKNPLENKKNMESIIEQRNELVKLIQTEYCDECNFNISGSKSLTSDIDITVLNKSEREKKSHLFAFNEIETMTEVMKCLFNEESLITLDVNFYGHSYFFNENLAGVCTKNKEHGNEYYLALDENLERKHRFCEGFALLKIKKYYQDLDPKLQRKWKLSFNDCESIMRNFSKFSSSKDDTDLFSYVNNDSNVSDKNRRYLKQLKYIDFEANHNQNKEDKKLLRYRLINEINHASLYSDESYFSYGAFMHVVYGDQMKRNISKLPKIIYVQSMLDNFGDILKVYNEYPEEVFSKGSKYIVRIYSCLKILASKDRKVRVDSLYSQFDHIRELYKGNSKDERIPRLIEDSQITLDEVKNEVFNTYLNKTKKRSIKK